MKTTKITYLGGVVRKKLAPPQDLIRNEAYWLQRVAKHDPRGHFPRLTRLNVRHRWLEMTHCGTHLSARTMPRNWRGQCKEILHSLKRAGCSHRDIRPGNLLVSGKVIKLIDFGWSCQIGLEEKIPYDPGLGQKWRINGKFNDALSLEASMASIRSTRLGGRAPRASSLKGMFLALAPKVWGLVQAKNEADIIGITLRHHMAMGMAGMVVFDNISEDSTSDVARSVDGVVVVSDKSPNFNRDMKNREMTRIAESMGAGWVVTIDADEFLYPVGFDSIPKALATVWQEFVGVRLFNHACTPLDDPSEKNPALRMKWRSKAPSPLLRTIHRCVPGSDIFTPLMNQHVIVDGVMHKPHLWDGLAIRHYSVRSFEHFRRKTLNMFHMNKNTPGRPVWASPKYHEWYAAYSRGDKYFRRYFEESVVVSANKLRDSSEWVRDPFRPSGG